MAVVISLSFHEKATPAATPESMQRIFDRQDSGQQAASIAAAVVALRKAIKNRDVYFCYFPAEDRRRLFCDLWDALPEDYKERVCNSLNKLEADGLDVLPEAQK